MADTQDSVRSCSLFALLVIIKYNGEKVSLVSLTVEI